MCSKFMGGCSGELGRQVILNFHSTFHVSRSHGNDAEFTISEAPSFLPDFAQVLQDDGESCKG